MKSVLSPGVDLLTKFKSWYSPKSAGKERIITIASKSISNSRNPKEKTLFIKDRLDKQWKQFTKAINGFDYEEGYEYEVTVLESSNTPLSLVRVLTKTKKVSDDLPDS